MINWSPHYKPLSILEFNLPIGVIFRNLELSSRTIVDTPKPSGCVIDVKSVLDVDEM